MASLAFPKPEPRPKKAPKQLRRTWMRKKPPRRLSRAGSDPAYLAWVRTQPCKVPGCASTLIHAHHAGRRPGVGLKASDITAIPLCLHHHACWHQAIGVFAGLSKLERFAWSQRAIAATQAAAHRAQIQGER